jgi:hypothetical protein
MGGTHLEDGREHGRGQHPSGEARNQWVRAPSFLAAGASQTARLWWGLLQRRERCNLRSSLGRTLTGPSSFPWSSGCLLEKPSNALLQTKTLESPVPGAKECRPVRPPHSAGRPPISINSPAQTLHDTKSATAVSLGGLLFSESQMSRTKAFGQ